MGEVYRARDTRLNRDVAIKVLSGPFATDPEQPARFDREAQLADAQELDPAGDWPVVTASGGALAYLAGPYVPTSRLTWIDAKGTFTPLTSTERPFVSVTLAPDGRRVATASLEAGRLLILLVDLERGTEEVPRIPGMNWNRSGCPMIYVRPLDGWDQEVSRLASTPVP